MCATLRPPSTTLYHSAFLSLLCHSLALCRCWATAAGHVQCWNPFYRRCRFLSPSISLSPSLFLLTLGPLPFAEKKPKANRKLMKSENVVAFSLLCFCYVLFFSFFLLRFVVVAVGFAQLQNIFWSLTFSFAHFFRCLPAAASSAFCLCSTFWNSACCCSSYSPLPLFSLYCKRFPN